MRRLRRAIRRELRLQFLACVVLLFMGLSLTYIFFTSSIVLTIIGLFLTVLGIRYTHQAVENRRPEDHRLFRLLRYQPGHIVWVYSMVTRRMPFGFEFTRNGTLYFKLIDGDEVSVSVPEKDLKLISRTLNRVLPHASFGYTPDREQWFLASPAMLLRGEEEGGHMNG